MKADHVLIAAALGVAAVLVLTATRRPAAAAAAAVPADDAFQFGGHVASPYSPFRFTGIAGGIGTMFDGPVSWA